MLSQNGEADILQLISVCKNAGDSVRQSNPVTGVLDFVESTVEDVPFIEKKTFQGLKPVKRADVVNQLSVIADAYSSHSYYTSGSWSMTEDVVFPQAATPPLSGVPFQGNPVRITSGFGYREEFGRNHYGIDLAMCVGDTVTVSLPGVVRQTGFDRFGYGRYVIVEHADGLETRYAHLSQLLAEVGDKLSTGDAVALSGNTGRSTGPHLHFETRYLGIPVNPMLVFDIITGNKEKK